MSFRTNATSLPPPPSRCKLTTYVSILSACAAGFVFGGLGISSATAQFVPPPFPSTYKEWKGPNGGSWDDAANWDGGLPSSNPNLNPNPNPNNPDNVLFGYEPVGGVVPPLTDDSIRQTVNAGSSDLNLRSLWFKAGLWYTLNGTGELWLGKDGGQDSHLLVVNPGDAGEQSEHTIEGFSYLTISWELLQQQTWKIENWSEGGLGIFTDKIRLYGDQHIQIGGTGATNFAGTLHTWGGRINVGLHGGTGEQPQPHFVLSANNSGWWGEVRVNYRGFAIIKADQALGDWANEKSVYAGGSLALRSHVETPLTYNVVNASLDIKKDNEDIVRSEGIVRNEGTQRIGALYNDGGKNHFGMRVTFALETFFGARGDRKGGLFLTNQVSGDGAQDSAAFVKVGPGLIVLANNTNIWTRDTVLRAGVLRLNNSGSLHSLSNLVFEGGRFGGILELGYDGFSRELGTSLFLDQISWTGDGGFSAFGGARSVSLSNNGTNNAALTWGSTANFIGDGHALLLSSRYADDVITFANAINLNGGQREVRVARGEDTAHAELSGVLSGSGGLVKTDDGLLRLTGANTYTGTTEIRGGALLGAAGNTASNIVLAGGILGLDGNFTRELGGSGNQIRWLGSGGFAAYGANRTVNLGGSGATLTWGTGSFVGNDSELRFGHYTANRTVLWDNALALGNGTRTIHIESGTNASLAVVNFRQAISGTAPLNVLGNGRIDFTADNSALSGTINLYGAELWLHGTGKLGAVGGFDIRHGGRLILNNTSTNSDADRLSDTADITLAAGTLRLDSVGTAISEEIGELTLESGANAIELSQGSASVELHIEALKRDGSSRATVNITGDLNDSLLSLKVEQDASGYGVNDVTGGDKIIPWAINSNGWLIAHSDDATNGPHFLKRLANANYYTAGESNWDTAHNVFLSGTDALTNTRTINSLRLRGNLALNGHTLTLNSGGLLSFNTATFSGGTGSTITTASTRPLYIHNWNSLTIGGSVRLTGGMDVVKSQPGRFTLNSSANHSIGNLYIQQGTVELRQGGLQVRHIYIGDGAGEDRLILPGGVWNPLRGHDTEFPSITLRGTPYDPRGPEYSGDQAILEMGGNTKQLLSELRIEGRGTIDWRGGEVGKANILWIDTLSFSSTNDRLFIRNWYEYEDLFLVKKVHNRVEFNDLLLNQIVFEGYQDYFTTLKNYDADYYQIYAFGSRPAPEPSTYGAILGAVGLGLWGWRKRRQQNRH